MKLRMICVQWTARNVCCRVDCQTGQQRSDSEFQTTRPKPGFSRLHLQVNRCVGDTRHKFSPLCNLAAIPGCTPCCRAMGNRLGSAGRGGVQRWSWGTALSTAQRSCACARSWGERCPQVTAAGLASDYILPELLCLFIRFGTKLRSWPGRVFAVCVFPRNRFWF